MSSKAMQNKAKGITRPDTDYLLNMIHNQLYFMKDPKDVLPLNAYKDPSELIEELENLTFTKEKYELYKLKWMGILMDEFGWSTMKFLAEWRAFQMKYVAKGGRDEKAL